MELLTQLFSEKHMRMLAAAHAGYDDQYKKQGEDHREWRATFYTRAKRFPSPFMPSHTLDEWDKLCEDEHPSRAVVKWLEDELKYWLDQTDDFQKTFNLRSSIPWDKPEFMLRVALIAEKKRIVKFLEELK